MKRSSLKRSTKPMRKRSAKMQARYAGTDGKGEGRRVFVERILRERPICQCTSICSFAAATDVHEMLRRSAGGSITDDANVLAVCRRCHTWIHANPAQAIALGYLKSRYAKGDGFADDMEEQ